MATGAERRKHRRHRIPCRLRVELPAGKGLRTRTHDVSDGGAYFVADEPLKVGHMVSLYLAVPRDTANTFFLEQFVASARVVRAEPTGEEGGKTGVAVRFEKALALDLP